ncbi:MAG TPA: winged helix-turn-helix domain-containing protein, partial [Pyrinomonadaceae bacterium]|nr:winged helix-turn-helix domain-containing protein [Pyrinomonadaceae bacterium]
MNEQINRSYEFGLFRLVPSERQLLRDGQRVMLPPKAFETLVILVQNSGHAVKKEDLIRTLWPEAFVEESNLNHYVSLLRKALGDGTNGERYIETVPKYGYRFTGEVRERHHETTALLARRHTRTHVVVREETEERRTESVVQANRFQTRSLQRVAVLTLALLIVGSTAVYFGYIKPAHSRSAGEPSAVSLRSSKAESPAARDAYLKGRYFWNQRTDEGFRKAADYFKQAIEIDPAFAPGYAGLADCYLLYGVALEQNSPYTFHEALKKALELDDSLGEAHATLAYYKSAVEWDWAGAEKEFE